LVPLGSGEISTARHRHAAPAQEPGNRRREAL